MAYETGFDEQRVEDLPRFPDERATSAILILTWGFA
jgi:hypothetical protein